MADNRKIGSQNALVSRSDNTISLTSIPLLDKQRLPAQMQIDGTTEPFTFLCDRERGERHLEARMLCKKLYQLGAIIVNKNPTTLLPYYHSIPEKQSIELGSAEADLRYIFLVKVALDLGTPEEVKKLHSDYVDRDSHLKMTMGGSEVDFPNGSSVGEHAPSELIELYILANATRFENMPKLVITDTIDGSVRDAEQRNQLEQILCLDTKKMSQLTQPAITAGASGARLFDPKTSISNEDRNKQRNNRPDSTSSGCNIS